MFEDVTKEIKTKVTEWSELLVKLPDDVISDRRNSQNRTVRQILGHLVDSAVNNHHRIVRLQYTPELAFPDYWQDNDTWIRIQNYQAEDFVELVAFWKSYNFHMIHIIKNIDADCLKNTWRNFQGENETIPTLVEGYLWHLNLHFKEIEALIG